MYFLCIQIDLVLKLIYSPHEQFDLKTSHNSLHAVWLHRVVLENVVLVRCVFFRNTCSRLSFLGHDVVEQRLAVVAEFVTDL